MSTADRWWARRLQGDVEWILWVLVLSGTMLGVHYWRAPAVPSAANEIADSK